VPRVRPPGDRHGPRAQHPGALRVGLPRRHRLARHGPGDFRAWSEVHLGGRWHAFDARYDVPRIGRIAMVRGRDAGDVPMITSFGPIRLDSLQVFCEEAKGRIAAE
jgi:transglutaminase-like putative cysteine protease